MTNRIVNLDYCKCFSCGTNRPFEGGTHEYLDLLSCNFPSFLLPKNEIEEPKKKLSCTNFFLSQLQHADNMKRCLTYNKRRGHRRIRYVWQHLLLLPITIASTITTVLIFELMVSRCVLLLSSSSPLHQCLRRSTSIDVP